VLVTPSIASDLARRDVVPPQSTGMGEVVPVGDSAATWPMAILARPGPPRALRASTRRSPGDVQCLPDSGIGMRNC